MNYNELLDKLYEYYSDLYQKNKKVGLALPIKKLDGERSYIKPPIQLFEELLTDDLFCQEIGIDIYSKELTHQERYKLWFRNNYETGMEYYDTNKVDFDNSYYEQTPEKLLTVKFNNQTYSCYK